MSKLDQVVQASEDMKMMAKNYWLEKYDDELVIVVRRINDSAKNGSFMMSVDFSNYSDFEDLTEDELKDLAQAFQLYLENFGYNIVRYGSNLLISWGNSNVQA